jgi:hypothetical protein
MPAIDPQTQAQQPQATAPADWYQNPQWPGERYWDGAQWTDEYRQPAWIKVGLKGPRASGGGAYAAPGICCACGSPSGAGELVKSNADAGKILAQYTFPLCDRCAAIHEQGRAGLFATHEEKEAWKERKEEWQRVDDAVRYRFHSTGYKATFSFRNRLFAEAFRELNLNPPKSAGERELAPETEVDTKQPAEVSAAEASAFEQREQAQLLNAIATDESPDADRWVEALEASDGDLRREAAVALCRAGDRRGLVLIDDIQGEDPELSDRRVDATIALGRVMLDQGESITESGLNVNAALALQIYAADHTDSAVREAASWELSRIPPT